MAKQVVWDNTFDSTPADTEAVSQGANRIRETRLGVDERMQIEHYWGAGAGDEEGRHKFPIGDATVRDTLIGIVEQMLFFLEDVLGTYLQVRRNGAWVDIRARNADQADNADQLDGLDSTQFLRADVNDYFSGTLHYNAGYGVALKFDADGNYHKWIAINDGTGGFTIKGNVGSDYSRLVDSGQAAISLNGIEPGGTIDGRVEIFASQADLAGTVKTKTYRYYWFTATDALFSVYQDGVFQETYRFDAFPSGTRMVFASAVPVGWALVTTVNDAVLRVVNTTAGGTGGSWTISGLSATTTVAGHALTIDEIPPHHHICYSPTVWETPNGYAYTGDGWSASVSAERYRPYTDDVGGGLAHSHGATTTISHDGTWRPAYLDVVVAEKQ